MPYWQSQIKWDTETDQICRSPDSNQIKFILCKIATVIFNSLRHPYGWISTAAEHPSLEYIKTLVSISESILSSQLLFALQD